MESDSLMTNFDVNQEPEENSVGYMVGHEGYHGRIEERIRQLEAVTARARVRYSLRNSLTERDSGLSSSSRCEARGNSSNCYTGFAPQESTFQSDNFFLRDRGSHLIAKALALDSPVEKPPRSGEGGFFDCNICLAMAKDPILTCCGHLFCWPCFYQLPSVNSSFTVRECPVCKGEVAGKGSITPIYGNGGGSCKTAKSSEYGFGIPPRPHARRIASFRQRRLSQAASLFPAQAIAESASSFSGGAPTSIAYANESPIIRLHGMLHPGFSSQGGELRAYLSSERSGDNMESFSTDPARRIQGQVMSVGGRRNLLGDASILQSEVHMNSMIARSSSPFSGQNDTPTATVPSETRAAHMVHVADPRMVHDSSSLRRRVSGDNGGVSQAPRRRRQRMRMP